MRKVKVSKRKSKNGVLVRPGEIFAPPDFSFLNSSDENIFVEVKYRKIKVDRRLSWRA